MSVRKYQSRPLSIEEWEVIVRGLEALELSLEEEFRVTGKSNPTVDEALLETLKTEFAKNIETYKYLEPTAHIVGDAACKCVDCLNHLEHSE